MTSVENSEPTGPTQEIIIQVLLEENQNINNNRIVLLATIKQIQAEFEEAKALWEAEKKSLKANK